MGDKVKKRFYIQDSRNYVGNSMVWWRRGNVGYTTNIDEAGIYSEEEAIQMHQNRESDMMWPVEFINTIIERHVDVQNCNRVKNGKMNKEVTGENIV